MLASYGIIFGIVVVNFFMGGLVLVNNRRRPVNQTFFIFVTGTCLWIVGILLIFISRQFVFNQIIFYGALLMFVGLLLFAKTFPSNRKPERSFWLLLIPLVALACLVPFNLFVKAIALTSQGVQPINGPAMPFLLGIVTLYLLYSLFLFLKNYRASRGVERLQIQYMLLGVFIFMICAVVFDGLLPVFKIFQLDLLGPTASIFLIGFTAYAILNYHLMDIEVIIRRGTVFTLLFGIVALFLAYATTFLSEYLPLDVARLVAALIVVLTFVPLKNFLEAITDKVFFRKSYKFEDAVEELNHILIRTVSLDALLSNLLNLVQRLLKVESASVLLAPPQREFVTRFAVGSTGVNIMLDRTDPIIRYFESNVTPIGGVHVQEFIELEALESTPTIENQAASIERKVLVERLKSLHASLALPFFSRNGLIGVLLVSAKRSQDPFSQKDLRFLDALAHETAVSLENALNVETLVKLDEAKSEFIMVVSHQLRTPLAAARWNLELLLEDALGTMAKEQQATVHDTYEALMVLNEGLNNLIIALEIEEEKAVVNYQMADLNKEVVQSTLESLKQEQELKGIRVEVEVQLPEPIFADVAKMRRILEVTLDNAIRYSPTGSVVRVIMKEVQQARRRLLFLSVDDQGIGISLDNRPLVFEKFFRGAEAKHMSPGGFGLGLFIAKAYAELLGGALWIGEKQPPGTLVCFALPLPPKPAR